MEVVFGPQVHTARMLTSTMLRGRALMGEPFCCGAAGLAYASLSAY